MTRQLEQIIARIHALAPDKVLEPAAGYVQIDGEGVTRWASGDYYFPMLNVDVRGDGNVVVSAYHAQARKMRQLVIHGHNNVVFLGPLSDVSSLDITITGHDNLVHVGPYTSAGGLRIRLMGNAKTYWLGEDCMLSSRVTLGDPDAISYFDRRSGAPLFKDDGIFVGDHCWLGRDATVRSGARLGEHAIVAQGSSVVGTFPAHSIVAGMPARQLPREPTTWQRLFTPHQNDITANPPYMAFRQKKLEDLRSYIDRIRDDGTLTPPTRAPSVPQGALRIQRDNSDIVGFRMSRAQQIKTPAFGLLVPQGDLRLMQDIRRLIPDAAGCLQIARFAVPVPMLARDIANSAPKLVKACKLLPTELTMQAVAIGCVATAATLGANTCSLSLRRSYPRAFHTDPISAAIAAITVLQPDGVAILSTLSESFNARIAALFGQLKLPLTRLATFSLPDHQQAASLDPNSVREAINALIKTPKTALVLALANNLSVPDDLENGMVLALGPILAWHMRAGAGLSTVDPAFGPLSGAILTQT